MIFQRSQANRPTSSVISISMPFISPIEWGSSICPSLPSLPMRTSDVPMLVLLVFFSFIGYSLQSLCRCHAVLRRLSQLKKQLFPTPQAGIQALPYWLTR